MKKAIIVGASRIIDSSFLDGIGNTFLVAADGGYLECLKHQIEPDILIGDFDTLDYTKKKKPKSLIKLNPIKDDTDTFYAVKLLLEKGFDEIHLYGCLGGKIEHTIGNIQILSYLKDRKIKAYLHSEDDRNVLFMLEEESFTFKTRKEGMLSIFSYTDKAENVTIKNLKYNIENTELTSSIPLGISNEFIDCNQNGFISVGKGRLLIIAPKDSVL